MRNHHRKPASAYRVASHQVHCPGMKQSKTKPAPPSSRGQLRGEVAALADNVPRIGRVLKMKTARIQWGLRFGIVRRLGGGRLGLARGAQIAMVGLSVVVAGSATRSNAGFTVGGQVIEEKVAGDGAVRATLEFSFEVNVEGNRWRIATEDLGVRNGSRSSVRFRQLVSDGRDVFELNEFPESLAQQSTNGSKNRFYGYARKGNFPLESWPLERILWLAFCSAPYLQQGGQKLPSFRDPANPQAQPMSCRLELAAASGLPTCYEQVSPGHLSFVRDDKTEVLPYPAPLNEGFVEFAFKVTALTNAGEAQVPLTFIAEFFIGESDFKSFARRRVSNRRVGKIEHAAEISKSFAMAQWRPEAASSANIYDYRFTTNGRPVMYASQAGMEAWLSREDPKLAATIASKPSLLMSGRKSKIGRELTGRSILVGLVVLASISSCLVWVWQQNKRQRTQ